jgi:hypothetical protein
MKIFEKKHLLQMTFKSMDAANRRLLQSSIDFRKIPAQQAYSPLSPCKKDGWADNLRGTVFKHFSLQNKM